jgi:acyl-CoA thioesterase
MSVTGVVSRFAADTAVRQSDDHRFDANVTDRWNGLAGRPLGGYVLAVALRALAKVAPFPDVFVGSAFFLAPVGPGAVAVHTEIARAGRRSATGQAKLYQDGTEALRATASFTNLAVIAGQDLMIGHAPDVSSPSTAVDLHDGAEAPTASIAQRVEYRVPGSMNRRPEAPGALSTTLWMRLKEGGCGDLLSIPFLLDAAPPAVLDLGATGSTTLELSFNIRARPRSDWLACRATTRYITAGYHEEDFEIWDVHGTLVAQSRQLAKLPRTDELKTNHHGDGA